MAFGASRVLKTDCLQTYIQTAKATESIIFNNCKNIEEHETTWSMNLLMAFTEGFPIFLMAHHIMSIQSSSWEGVSLEIQGRTWKPVFYRYLWNSMSTIRQGHRPHHRTPFIYQYKRDPHQVCDKEPDWIITDQRGFRLQLEIFHGDIDDVNTIEYIFEKKPVHAPRTAILSAATCYDAETRSLWLPFDNQTMVIRFTWNRIPKTPLQFQPFLWQRIHWLVGEFTCYLQ